MAVPAGSQLSAGLVPATLKLLTGGQVRICPRSRINVNGEQASLILGMDTGAIEVDFELAQNSTETIVTPDLSVRMAGPGRYHFALGVTGQGDTCFKPRSGNKSGIVVSELMGSEEYGITADQSVLFPGGKPSAQTRLTSECGCPVAAPILAAEGPGATESTASAVNARSQSGTQPAPSPSAEEKQPSHLTVEAPFVFSADAPPAPARVQYSALPNIFLPQIEVDPSVLPKEETTRAIEPAKPTAPVPAADDMARKEKKGFLSRLKGFFTGLFHR